MHQEAVADIIFNFMQDTRKLEFSIKGVQSLFNEKDSTKVLSLAFQKSGMNPIASAVVANHVVGVKGPIELITLSK
jgi:hypothetical protein